MIPFPPIMMLVGAEAGIHGWSSVFKSNNLTLSGSVSQVATRTSVANGTAAAVRSLQGRLTGKWYAEMTYTLGSGSSTAADTGCGLFAANDLWENHRRAGFTANSVGWRGDSAVDVYKNDSQQSPDNIHGLTSGDVICLRADLDAHTLAFRRNGGSFSSNFSLTAGITYYLHATLNDNNGDVVSLNTGQSAFAQAIPSGFIAWSGS